MYGITTYSGLGGVALGAGLMYLLDPSGGRRRRAELRQKATHASKEAQQAGRITGRDVAHRGRGLAYRALTVLRRDRPDDDVLAARVRARLGRYTSHSHAIEVGCSQGCVQLKGPILADELAQVLGQVRRVRGVREIDNRLEPHATAGHVPALQGAGKASGERAELLQRNWSPAARVAVGATGCGLVAWGLSERGVAGTVGSAAGSILFLRAATNLEFKRLVGIGAGPRAIDIQKAITVNAPPEEVFAFFEAFENFPRFMMHVKEIKRIAADRWRWSVAGPAGVPFEWEARVTEYEPNRVIAWRSIGKAAVKNVGTVRFDPVGPGSTRVSVRMSYNPPAGAIGHGFAKLLGADPKKQMDDDLLRFKSLIETGRATGHETVTREQLQPALPSGEPMRH